MVIFAVLKKVMSHYSQTRKTKNGHTDFILTGYLHVTYVMWVNNNPTYTIYDHKRFTVNLGKYAHIPNMLI